MEKKTKNFIKCALAGIGAGIANGLFGSGGGMILVPAFTALSEKNEKRAFATSVFCVLFMSICSIFLYSHARSVAFSELWPYLVGGAAGGILGAVWFKSIPTKIIRKVFAVFILWAAIRALFS